MYVCMYVFVCMLSVHVCVSVDTITVLTNLLRDYFADLDWSCRLCFNHNSVPLCFETQWFEIFHWRFFFFLTLVDAENDKIIYIILVSSSF